MVEPDKKLGLSEAEIEHALGLLNVAEASAAESTEPNPADLRKTVRWDYWEPTLMLSVTHPGGGKSHYQVGARNISNGGMGLLHCGYLHLGSECKIAIRRHDGREDTLDAKIVFCRHVERRVHELGLAFDREIDLAFYVALGQATNGEELRTIDHADLRGNVLYIEDSEADRRLVAHHLKKTGIELSSVETSGAAIDAVKLGMVDIILCDLNLQGDDGVVLIKRLRETGFDGPIVIVSAETHSGRIESAMEAGASSHLSKPFSPDELMGLMARHHVEVGAALSSSAVQSSFEGQEDMYELIESFVKDAKQHAIHLKRSIGDDDFQLTREIMLNIKGTAESYGFMHLTTIAVEALKSMDATMSIAESGKLLRKVRLICENLNVQDPSASTMVE